MKKHNLLLLGLLLLTSLFLKAENNRYCKVVQSDYNKISLVLQAGDISATNIKIPNAIYTQIEIDGFYPSSNVGDPNLPVLSQLIEIPICKGVSFKVINSESMVYPASQLGIEHQLYPTQPSYSKSEEGPFPFVKNDNTYTTNEFYGTDVIRIENVGIARNKKLANIYFSPIKYNPVSNEIKITKSIEIEITFEDSDVEATRRMKKLHYSPMFSVKTNIANNIEKDLYTTGPLKYLIVSHASFRGQLDDFVQWKKRKGFLVDIVYTDDANVGSTSSSIQSYIKTQYTNATPENPAPTYVLLVGDVQQIPPFDSRITSSSLNDHITDLYYFTWTDGDIIPDCYYGRFSAQTVGQLTPQIEKTLMYEQYLMEDPSYLDKALVVAGVDGGSQGDFGYTHADPVIHYLEENYVNTNYGYTSVTSYYNPASGTSAAETGVYNALSNGVGYANYTAHCNYNCWGEPYFDLSDVNRMQNTQKFGLMIGNCCLSNKFDVSECLGEALLRKNNYRGAVGYIGGSNSTYWNQDYWWAVGVRSINTSTCPTPTYNAANLGAYDHLFHTHNEAYTDWYTSNGAIIMAGNMAVQTSTTSENYKKYYWEIYHLMGDPSVMSYLTQADSMTINVNTTLFNDAENLIVQVAPYSYVALKDNNNNLIASTFANANGDATLNFSPLNTVGVFELVASAQNYKTAFVDINVIAPEGPFVYVQNIEPQNDRQPIIGDDVRLDIDIANVGVENAENVWVEISSTNTKKLLVYDTMINVGNLSVEQSYTISPTIHILSSTTNGEQLSLNIKIHYSTDETTNYTYRFSAMGYSISRTRMELENSNIERVSFAPGDTITLTVKYKNDGNIAFRNLRNNIYSTNSLIDFTNNRTNIALLPIDNEIELGYTIRLNESLIQNVVVPVYITLSNNVYTYTDTISISLDATTENFETGDFTKFSWNNTSNNPWEITSSQKYKGSYSMRSKTNLNDNSTSQISITWTSTIDDSISYYRKTSSEANYDKFYFYIDDTEMENMSGVTAWERAAFYIPAGTHTFTFAYTKDYSVSKESDCAWIDNIHLPLNTTAAYTYITDTVCQGTTFVNGNINVNTANLEPGNHYYIDSTSTENIRFIMLTVSGTPNVSISGNTDIAQGESTKLTASGADKYMWNNGETLPEMQVMPSATTIYTVVGYAKGCDNDTASIKVIVDGIGLMDMEEISNIALYPNPTNKYVSINSDIDIKKITVFNTMGQMVDMIDTQCSKSYKWNVEKYINGTYLLLIEFTDGRTKRMQLMVVE